MSPVRACLAVAAGLLLASFPFLRYAHVGPPGAPHADHAPRYGGQLGMVGDYHVEVRRHRGAVETFVSDAWRRPVRPREGWIGFDRAASLTPLTWENDRFVGSDTAEARELRAVVILSDGTRLSIDFDFSPSPAS